MPLHDDSRSREEFVMRRSIAVRRAVPIVALVFGQRAGAAQGQAQPLTPGRVTCSGGIAEQGDTILIWVIHPRFGHIEARERSGGARADVELRRHSGRNGFADETLNITATARRFYVRPVKKRGARRSTETTAG